MSPSLLHAALGPIVWGASGLVVLMLAIHLSRARTQAPGGAPPEPPVHDAA